MNTKKVRLWLKEFLPGILVIFVIVIPASFFTNSWEIVGFGLFPAVLIIIYKTLKMFTHKKQKR
ncbi:MAG: hypothetical protein ACEPOW_13335 [Bacteroidales bacterium]